ncbi:hypothetical protein FXO38_16787 [Capsicum annuum]|uniref:Uncharacterized protein n=1 Tax=Capsicum annuum TaxID=4072 RepID=A0A2G2ZY41_CAPAN|nr:hypothetical protein FXO37_28735 [Capsicum annuum]KAF3651089.1 hypothetical protein FXO38_16787 [Capsicum annuum]PHT86878.1 hypothetical protein T459_08984 [Capsicum annuum]
MSIEKVIISGCVVDSPFCFVTGEYGWTANMKRIMKKQDLRDSSMTRYISSKKTMELNLVNAIMDELRKRAYADKNNKFVKMLKLGLIVDEDSSDVDVDIPKLLDPEVDTEGSKMKEID